ncbi:hypothetical protein [uncultured Actinomyces sp.]|uniref:hypothetical protein n=1 Tax=uncultured Actinomyces sp. TaxID=249061 RepID=UPI00267104E0|nr:hypothetical protein [uncultured Actinomyces sp.]
MTTEMLIPAKYKDDIDQLVHGHHGLHGLRHRIAWALMPECIRALVITGLMVALHPDDVMNALFEKSLNEYADQAAATEANEETHQ